MDIITWLLNVAAAIFIAWWAITICCASFLASKADRDYHRYGIKPKHQP